MAGPLDLLKIPSMVRKVGRAASEAKPFYSAVDEAIESLPNKALGDQFIKELLKRGAKPQEIIDRNLDQMLGAPIVQKTRTVQLKKPDKQGRTEVQEKYFEVTPSEKGSKAITKEEVQRAAAENPPPQVRQEVLKAPRSEDEFRIESDNYRQYGDRFVEVPEEYYVVDKKNDQRIAGPFETHDDAGNRLAVIAEGGTSYSPDVEPNLTIPGGENYREILIKLPGLNYRGHFGPDTLAHARVSDRYQLTYTPEQAEEIGKKIAAGINVSDPNNLGNGAPALAIKKGIITPLEGAQYSHYRGFQNVPLDGAVKKMLHIEEIQSDLHQAGRKEGYQLPEAKRQELDVRRQEIEALGGNATPEQRQEWTDIKNQLQQPEAVPDAPFKKNWHELVMKRLLDDASRNGYDKVIVTPGAEQAKRYDLSKRVRNISWNENDGVKLVSITPRSGNDIEFRVLPDGKITDSSGRMDSQFAGKNIDDVVGKEIGKNIQSEKYGDVEGEGLKVGGEGMQGFYDQMLPAFVNRYGEKTGLRMNLGTTPIDGKQYRIFEDANENPFSVVPEGGSRIVSRHPTREEAEAAMAELNTQPMHSIDITPEFRESVMQKGQPLYQVAPPAAIGAAAMQEEQPTEYARGGSVNRDAMWMAVQNKQLRKRHA